MDTFFALVWFVSIVIFFRFLIGCIKNLRDSFVLKNCLKRAGISFLVSIISLGCFGVFSDTTDTINSVFVEEKPAKDDTETDALIDNGTSNTKNIENTRERDIPAEDVDSSEIDSLVEESTESDTYTFDLALVPEYCGKPYVELNDNIPLFTTEEMIPEAFESYSPLDSKGRCGVAYANICKELMPTEERGSIGEIKPSGWHTANYHNLIDGNYLYNRCHLIAFCLAGENANARNLITGTRYMNIEGMLPFEERVESYVERTGNHVLYRSTPIFDGDNLVASGVEIEAKSVEDSGAGICFHVYCYNVQPHIIIDYANGDSQVEEGYVVDDGSNNGVNESTAS